MKNLGPELILILLIFLAIIVDAVVFTKALIIDDPHTMQIAALIMIAIAITIWLYRKLFT